MNSIETTISNLESAIKALKETYALEKKGQSIQNQERDFETVNTELCMRF